MIIIESKRKKVENIAKQHPNAPILDVTSKARTALVALSPFYPHGGIPIPFSEGMTGACVEAIWQGLKVFENEGVDTSAFSNSTMHNIKRTTKLHGRVLGHQKGVYSTEILSYQEAKHLIYIPTYKWVLEHKCSALINKLRAASKTKTIVLLDYNTCQDVDDARKPLSHAFLIKAYVEGIYPYGPKCKEPVEEPEPKAKTTKTTKATKPRAKKPKQQNMQTTLTFD